MNGPYSEFAKSGRYSSDTGEGRWQLADKALSIIGAGAAIRETIAEADTSSLTMEDEQGQQASYGRCTQADMAAAQPDGVDEGDYDEKEDASGIDAQNPPDQ